MVTRVRRPPVEQIFFGPFCLDRTGARLLREGKPVALTPKAFDLLQLLATKPGRLITKEELLESIWPDAFVSDASIKVCVSEVRKALDDGAKTPQYIETVHRRGYRFIGLGSAKPEADAPPPSRQMAAVPPALASVKSPPSLPLAGRDAEIGRLVSHFERASRGQRQCVLVSGSVGSGKTVLVQAFVQSLGQEATILIGHCFEQFGNREPYLPVWEAIRSLPQERRSAPLESLLARHAAAVAAGSEADGNAADTPVNTRLASSQRVLGEMVDAIETLAEETPALLLLEDVHWIDHSTLDLLTALARRRRESKLMVVATFRPDEVLAAEEDEHPLREVVGDLITARLAEALPLEELDEKAVAEYLSRRFAGADFPTELSRRLHERTDGHPLFLVHLVDDLVEQRVIVQHDGAWRLNARESDWQAVLNTQVPQSVRAMIDLQLRRLEPREQQVLEAAAVAGVECSAAAAAAALGEGDVVAVERVCEELARRHRFLEPAPAGVSEWPDGTVSSQYRFVHELYHNVVYQHVGVARRAQLHRALGLRLETAWGDRATEESATLATHFEIGRDWPRALRYLRSAGDAAARQYAHYEAAEYFRRALAALARLPDDEARRSQELPLLMSLGLNMQVTQGCAAPAVEQVFHRAMEILRATGAAGDTHKIFPLLWGVWVFHKVRSDLREADELARRMLFLAQQAGDATLLMQAHQAMCVTSLCVGNPTLTVEHMLQAERIYDPKRHANNTNTYGQDPGIATLALGAVALCILDQADEAMVRMERALELARQVGQPSTANFVLHFAAMLHQLRGDAAQTQEYAGESIAFATEESFSFWRAGGMVLHGWAVAVQEQDGRVVADALKEIGAGLEAWTSTGSRTYLAYFLGLQADALLRHHRQADALRAVDEALHLAATLPEGLYESPLHHIKSRCLADDNAPAAKQRLVEAIRIAADQGAAGFERQARTPAAMAIV